MLTLCCLVVGEGSIVSVKSKESRLVGELKKVIKFKMSNLMEFAACELMLYLAKRGEGKADVWLSYSNEDDTEVIAALSSPGIPKHVRDKYLKNDLQMDPTLDLGDDEYFGKQKPGNQHGEVHVLVELPPSRLPKSARLELKDERAESLWKKIQALNCDRIFDIQSVTEVPFPSLISVKSNRFQLNERGCFQFQARQELKPLYDDVVELWHRQVSLAVVNLAGTTGYGKSYMLAVLVVLLMKFPSVDKSKYGAAPFVCYIPDCGELLSGESAVVAMMKQNILLNIPDYTGRLEITEDICPVLEDRRVIFVGEEWTSIDHDDEASQLARRNLDLCMGLSVDIHILVTSKNNLAWFSILHKQTCDINQFYFGGLSDDEFGVWLQNHHQVFRQNEDELVELTGKIPLLLSVFDRVHQDGDSWECGSECLARCNG